MNSRRFDPANVRGQNKFGMVPAWWVNKLRELPASAHVAALMFCFDIHNLTGITRASRTMTEWATECNLDRGTLRAALIELKLSGMIAIERNITATGQKEARTAFRIQFLFANPDNNQAHPTNGPATATSSNTNGEIRDQLQRQRITTPPRSQTLDCAPEGRFEKFSALYADKASIERGENPQRLELVSAGKSRIEPEPDWMTESGVSELASYEPGADGDP